MPQTIRESTISGCKQMCQHKKGLGSVVGLCFKYFVMYLEQRFVEPKREGLELVSNTLCTTSFTGVYRFFVAS